jgi:hypothetical protein
MNERSKYAKEKMQRCFVVIVATINEHDFFNSMNERSKYAKEKMQRCFAVIVATLMNMISSTQ